jgi:hypothetical protein
MMNPAKHSLRPRNRVETGGPLLSKRAWTVTVAVALSVFALCAVFQETDPLSGNWEVARATDNGEEVTFQPGGMLIMPGIEIKGDYAKVAWFTLCGSCSDRVLAEGFMVRKGDRIDLYKRIRMTPELEKTPCGYITVLKNGHLMYETSGKEGPLIMEFRRESNANTILDLLNWH